MAVVQLEWVAMILRHVKDSTRIFYQTFFQKGFCFTKTLRNGFVRKRFIKCFRVWAQIQTLNILTHFLLYSRLKSGLSLRRRCALFPLLGTIFLIGSGHWRPHPTENPIWTLFVFLDPRAQTRKVSCFLELVVVAIVLPLSVVLPIEAHRRPLLGDSEARCSAIA